jgi:hypothetical protein
MPMPPLRRFDKVVLSAAALAVLTSIAALAAVVVARPLVATLVVVAATLVAMAGLAWALPRLYRGRRGA